MGLGAIQGGQANNAVASRAETDVENVKRMAGQVEIITDRIIRHACTLGYYEPTPEAKAVAATPVITTLADALRGLNAAIDHCSGSLNVFD